MPAFQTLDMSTVYMHQIATVGQANDRHFEAILTDLPVQLEDIDRKFMIDRFIDALVSRALRVVPSDKVDSPTPKETRRFFEDQDLLGFSKFLASRLAEVQRLTAKPGLMVVADATLDGIACVLVAKVEHQEAMRAEQTTNENGLKGISIEHIRDLVFSELNRVYKIALLFTGDVALGADETSTDTEPMIAHGYLADVQNGRNFANYYIGEFLGMKLGEQPVVLTERYLNVLSEAIEISSLDANEKIKLHSALSVELSSNMPTLDAGDFIRTHVPAHSQQEVELATVARGMPLVTFSKDAGRVRNRLSNLRLNLGAEISINAPASLIGAGGTVIVEPHPNSANEELYDVIIRGVPLSSVSNSNVR